MKQLCLLNEVARSSPPPSQRLGTAVTSGEQGKLGLVLTLSPLQGENEGGCVWLGANLDPLILGSCLDASSAFRSSFAAHTPISQRGN